MFSIQLEEGFCVLGSAEIAHFAVFALLSPNRLCDYVFTECDLLLVFSVVFSGVLSCFLQT